ncbi:hypothetical protein AAFC00_002851 [Neodothiora populina]|uniref:Guanine nucleotide-exchange factor SEC12 n=1 Tax=Neodothiora populina TaxID=2781224 RepID=A0ABR3P8F6_9PEZI
MVFNPAGPISFTKTTLSYPVYTADFDPYNRGYLVVAGGGGEGRSGVGNKITVLDSARRGILDTVTEIELSRDEDSVTSIANLASKDGLITLAGINSSLEEQKAGKNEHLRTFQITFPKRQRVGEKSKDAEKSAMSTSDGGSIDFAGKTGLFTPATGPKPETYQRLLRLSPPIKRESGNRRIGACATGLAKRSEIVIFDATRTPPKPSEIISKIAIRDNTEAADLDISENIYENTFSVAWCTDYDVYEQTIAYNFTSGKAEFTPPSPRRVHSVPLREDATKPPRAKYRSIRWLTEEDLLVVTNKPNKTGAELHILHLYPSGPAMILFHKILPSHVKQAVALDVCALDADKKGNRQFVVAVAGQDISICVYTIDFNAITRTFSSFRKFTTLRDVHPLQMTTLTFSTFHSPVRTPISRSDEVKNGERKSTSPVPAHPGPQYIKLCSASMGNTVVVETMALTPLEPEKRDSRYVLSHPSDAKFRRNAFIIVISFIVLVSSILLQSLFFPDTTPITSLLPIPDSVRSLLSHPASVSDGFGRSGREKIAVLAGSASSAASSASASASSASDYAGQKISDLLHLHFSSSSSSSSPDSQTKALVVRDGMTDSSVSLDVISDRQEFLRRDTQAREWSQLAEHEKQAWKQRLVAAGHWSVEEGERVLKGILFSSWAGMVGQVAGEAIREL